MNTSKFVDFRAVKREVSIVQVLEHYGVLEGMHRRGDSITGACPIHGGKNETSFRVSISKNAWNCFSQCGSGGNVLDFVAKKENVSVLKAANLLVDWFDLQVSPYSEHEPEDSKAANKPPKQRHSNEPRSTDPKDGEQQIAENKPLDFTLKNLQTDHPYLAQRGLTKETVETFGLGFCSKGLHKGYIVIPIHNEKGQIVAFAGRWPGDSDKPKYQLPKGFMKSLELFNLHRAIVEPEDRPLVVVEGYFDCMKLWQHGIKRVVALMGSSLSPAQESLLRKHTTTKSRIVLMLDEDDAGRKGREEIALRLARFAFVKVCAFEKPGTQPESLTLAEVQQFLGDGQ